MDLCSTPDSTQQHVPTRAKETQGYQTPSRGDTAASPAASGHGELCASNQGSTLRQDLTLPDLECDVDQAVLGSREIALPLPPKQQDQRDVLCAPCQASTELN